MLGTMLVAGLFEAFALGVKEFRPLGDHAPWMDDPYDVVTSFAIFFIPIVGAFSAVRLALCRRFEPLPVSRVIDLMHGCVVLLVVALATAASDWIAVVVGADRGSWTSVTPALVAGLGLVTMFALLAAGATVTESRRLPRLDRADLAAPDWLADATVIAGRVSGRLGPLESVASRIVRVVDRQLWAMVRQRPITAAVVTAAGFAALFDVGSLREGYSLPLLAFVLVVAWCGMFVLLVASGSYLGLVRSAVALRGSGGGCSMQRSLAVPASRSPWPFGIPSGGSSVHRRSGQASRTSTCSWRSSPRVDLGPSLLAMGSDSCMTTLGAVCSWARVPMPHPS